MYLLPDPTNIFMQSWRKQIDEERRRMAVVWLKQQRKQYHSRTGLRKEKLSCLSLRARACPDSLIQNILYSLADQMKAITNKTFCSSNSRWQFVLLLFLKKLVRWLASVLQGFICLLVKL